ncbi:hypothetical protein BT63DRAFT_450324 [Microthyrium microscopicum]|uniref:BHLH domain-containing protein n=1 Tax=Microthyrium microscopicum TaxID=703497 RepID=A0A6A6UV27_9PEZI|nr:hypothetical protein BT63DRAFT_450324 [Microthyrium microscopicum]
MTMDSTHRHPPHMPQGHGQGQSLPPITSITAITDQHTPLPSAEMSPLPFRTTTQAPDRDSGNWSASKHSSGVSNIGFPLTSILNAEDSPSRNSIPNSIPETPHSAKLSGQASTLPSLTQPFDPRGSIDAASYLDSSRRSSVDSRVYKDMTHLQISPSTGAPYDNSQNVSRSSLVSNLQQQRGISDGRNSLPNPNPLSPLGQRNGVRSLNAPPRRAPTINPNPRNIPDMPNPTAENPTKGFAWAFPDSAPAPPSEHQRRSSSASDGRPSRQNSYAASVGSSIFTNDSALPAGQKRFSDPNGDMPHTHHHSLQHASMGNLRPGEPMSATSPASGSYSRTPELRISHKMAERKRRSEMKGLFDDLNNILPTTAGGKSSKWEVLTRAIDHIKVTKAEVARASQFRGDFDQVRRDNVNLRDEAQAMYHQLRRMDPNQPHVYGNFTSTLAAHDGVPQQPPPPPPPAMNRPLPPMQNQWPQGSNSMQGVEYPGHGFDRR